MKWNKFKKKKIKRKKKIMKLNQWLPGKVLFELEVPENVNNPVSRNRNHLRGWFVMFMTWVQDGGSRSAAAISKEAETFSELHENKTSVCRLSTFRGWCSHNKREGNAGKWRSARFSLISCVCRLSRASWLQLLSPLSRRCIHDNDHWHTGCFF